MINVFVCEHVESNHEYACNMQTFFWHPFLVDRVHFCGKVAKSYIAPFFEPLFLQ